MLTLQNKETLRALAGQMMEFATCEAQLTTQKLWAALNTGNMQRPMITIDEVCWHEMDFDGSLLCTIEDPYWRQVENALRQCIYRYRYMPVDMVIPPYVLLPHVLVDPLWRDFGIHITENTAAVDGKNDVVSHDYINQFESIEDVEKIKFTELRNDKVAEAAIVAQAHEIFDGVAPFVFEGIDLHCGLWDIITMWMNIEDCYYNLYDEPEMMHAIIDRVTNATAEIIKQGNEHELFNTVTGLSHCSVTIDKPFSATPEKAISTNAWTFGMAQLFSSVSPAITKEYEAVYMQKLFGQFKDVYYGCCERLDDRLDIVMSMPNIRKISCSPWSDREAFAEKLPKNIIMSNKPNPALVGGDVFDADVIADDLRRTMRAAKANNIGLELLLKDNSTVQYEPQRLHNFSKLALAVAEEW